MVGDVGDREPRILEEARCADQPSDGEIALRCWQASAKESAHQGARQHREVLRERANGRDLWWCGEQGLEETPAVVAHAAQVDGKLTQGAALHAVDLCSEQKTAELAPARGLTDIDELSHSALAKQEHRARRAWLDVGEQGEGWYAGELAHHHFDAGTRDLVAAGDRHKNGRRTVGLEVPHDVVDVVAMKCPIRAFAGRVDADSLGRREYCGYSGER